MQAKKYTGVIYKPILKQYESRLTHKGIVYNCGFYETEK